MKLFAKFVFSSVLWFFLSPGFALDQISLSQVQLYNLGIKLGALQHVQQIPLLYAPATVVIPPDQEYIVSAPQAGLVSRLYAAIGDTVKRDQRLADIKSPELLALQRQFLKTESNRRLAWANYQRDKKLHDEGVISDRRWQETRSKYTSFAAEVNEARQLLEIAGVADGDIKKLAKSRRLSSLLTIRAPIDGVVLHRSVVAGERIDILAPLYRIANLDQLWLEIKIPQEHAGNLKVGDQVLISGSAATAHITLIGKNVNPQNQTVLARAVIEGKHDDIRAGQSVNTQIVQTSKQPVFKLPNTAIAGREGQSYVFARTESGFTVVPVTVLGKQGNDSIISGDFSESQQVAVRGAVALKAKWLRLGEEGGN